MKRQLFQTLGAILSRAASIGDEFVGSLRTVADACSKAGGPKAVVCPYCQEDIQTVADHVMWCDLPATLKAPLADEATKWPVIRYGFSVDRPAAEMLTREVLS